MKKIIVILAGIIFPLALAAQDTPLSDIYDDFVSQPGYSTQEIIPSGTSTEWEKDLSGTTIREVMDQISSIRILSANGEEGGSMKSLWKSVSKAASKADYFKLLEVSSDDESITLYGLKSFNGNMKEFALTLKEPEKVMLVTVTGEMDMSTFFSKDMMKDLKKLGENFHGKECMKEF
jgi:hypothetical protein